MSTHRLFYFDPTEFRGWYERLHPRLAYCLDIFRHMWGSSVIVSPANGAIGRRDDSQSRHNVNAWGRVEAIDVMPDGLRTASQAQRAVDKATQACFTGIGIYPHWRPDVGMHLDVRGTERPGRPATWGAVDYNRATQSQKRRGRVDGGQVYVSIEEAIGSFST